MNEAQIKQLLPRASKDLIALNKDQPDGRPQSPKPERAVHHGSVGKAQGEEADPARRLVSITSYRVREIDPDNLIGKWFVDCLRMAKIIHDDSASHITYQITQKKVETKEQEKTLIEVI